jgi:hypothetical protein
MLGIRVNIEVIVRPLRKLVKMSAGSSSLSEIMESVAVNYRVIICE